MGDTIRNVGPSASGGAGVPAHSTSTPAAKPVVQDALRQIVHHSPVLAPVDALQTVFAKPSRAATVSALFPDTTAQETADKSHPPAIAAISMAELQRLGSRKDKTAFFKALLPGALESERTYGVPASVILAQAALESGWGKHAIGGYNLFGIKGEGTAGSRLAWTSETLRSGRKVRVQARFAQFKSFADAVREHGQVFHNGHYDRALALFKQTRDPHRFIDAIARTYASSKTYAADLKGMVLQHDLRQLCQKQGGH